MEDLLEDPVILNPQIELIGPSEVEIPLADSYIQCPNPRPLSLVCDMGATAYFTNGQLASATVEACSNGANRYNFLLFGISQCELDTSSIG